MVLARLLPSEGFCNWQPGRALLHFETVGETKRQLAELKGFKDRSLSLFAANSNSHGFITVEFCPLSSGTVS